MDQVRAFFRDCTGPLREIQLNFTSLNKVIFLYLSIRVFVDGAEEYLIQSTAWYYLKYLGESKVFLGLTLAAFPVAICIFSPLIGIFETKFNATKAIVLSASSAKIFASFLYSIPVDGYFPLFGRFISGMAESTIGVFYGLVARGSSNENRPKAFLYFEGLYTAGAMFGPAIGSALIFKINIFGWEINEGNSPGVLLACVWLSLIILGMFIPSNLAENSQDEEMEQGPDSSDKISEKQSDTFHTTSTVCCLYYIIFLSFIFFHIISFYTPLLAVYHLGLKLVHVKLIYVNSSLAVVVLYIATYFFLNKTSEKKYLFIALATAIVPVSITFYFAYVWKSTSSPFHAVYLLISMIIMSVKFINFALASSLLSKITPSNRAAFYQSLAVTTAHLAVIIGRVIAGATFHKIAMMFTCFGLAIAWAAAILWMAFEYKNLPSGNSSFN